MDIVKTPPPRPFHRKYGLLIAGLVLLGAAFVVVAEFRGVSFIVFRDQIVTATVERGELVVSVSAYGQLEPKGAHWVGAETEGLVEAIHANPGDHVHAGQLLVQLGNPQLVRQLRDVQLDFEARTAELQAVSVEQDAQQLLLAADIANAELDYRLAQKEAEARQTLARNVQSVSALEVERAEFLAEQQRQRWYALKQQHTKLADARAERMHVEQLRLKQLEHSLQDLREQVEHLKIRALSGGTVQALDFELGQRVAAGQLITRIARTDQLIAGIDVPELQVNAIEVGMPARIDTRASHIEGRVLRIDPAVRDGTVRVELALLGALPPEARPALNIEATIELARIAETLYAKRPVGVREFGTANLFRLEEGGEFAHQVTVNYGRLSSSFVEILEGLQAGDEIIVSDTGELVKHQRVWLK